MSNRLIYDYCRCHGYNCLKKESCKRFLTIALDEADAPNRRNPVLYSHASSLAGYDDKVECESFIEAGQE